MKISQKLILVIFINLVAVVGLGAVSYLGIKSINDKFNELVKFPIPSILRLSNMTESLILSVEEAHSYQLYGLTSDKQDYYEHSAKFNRLLTELKQELSYGTSDIPPEDVKLIDSISKETDALNKTIIAEFARYDEKQGTEKSISDPFSAQKEKIVTLLRQYRDMEQEEIVVADREVNTATDEVILSIFFSAIVILILNLLINGLIARSISAPLHELWETARQLGIGDLSKRVTIPNKDEFGTLGAAFNIMANNLQKSHSDLEARLVQGATELKKAKAELDEAVARHAREMGTVAPSLESEPVSAPDPQSKPTSAQVPPQTDVEPVLTSAPAEPKT